MAALYALILGVIEGLTEFLPISSTGHLIIAEKYIDFKDAAKVFTVVIQVGAILAVVWYYRVDLFRRVKSLFGHNHSGTGFWVNLIVAAIPAGLAGVALDKYFERYSTPIVVAMALIIGGIILWLVDRSPSTSQPAAVKLDSISKKQALTVGLVQCLALIPGVSRSGASIVGGLTGKMNRPTATAFSFYLGIPILIAAGMYKLATDWHSIRDISGGPNSIVIGSIAAFITALFAVSWLLHYVSTHNFRLFAYYRVILGILVLLLLH